MLLGAILVLLCVATGAATASRLSASPCHSPPTKTFVGASMMDPFSWNDHTNWHPAGVPGPDDAVLVHNASIVRIPGPAGGLLTTASALCVMGSETFFLIHGDFSVASFEAADAATVAAEPESAAWWESTLSPTIALGPSATVRDGAHLSLASVVLTDTHVVVRVGLAAASTGTLGLSCVAAPENAYVTQANLTLIRTTLTVARVQGRTGSSKSKDNATDFLATFRQLSKVMLPGAAERIFSRPGRASPVLIRSASVGTYIQFQCVVMFTQSSSFAWSVNDASVSLAQLAVVGTDSVLTLPAVAISYGFLYVGDVTVTTLSVNGTQIMVGPLHPAVSSHLSVGSLESAPSLIVLVGHETPYYGEWCGQQVNPALPPTLTFLGRIPDNTQIGVGDANVFELRGAIWNEATAPTVTLPCGSLVVHSHDANLRSLGITVGEFVLWNPYTSIGGLACVVPVGPLVPCDVASVTLNDGSLTMATLLPSTSSQFPGSSIVDVSATAQPAWNIGILTIYAYGTLDLAQAATGVLPSFVATREMLVKAPWSGGSYVQFGCAVLGTRQSSFRRTESHRQTVAAVQAQPGGAAAPPLCALRVETAITFGENNYIQQSRWYSLQGGIAVLYGLPTPAVTLFNVSVANDVTLQLQSGASVRPTDGTGAIFNVQVNTAMASAWLSVQGDTTSAIAVPVFNMSQSFKRGAWYPTLDTMTATDDTAQRQLQQCSQSAIHEQGCNGVSVAIGQAGSPTSGHAFTVTFAMVITAPTPAPTPPIPPPVPTGPFPTACSGFRNAVGCVPAGAKMGCAWCGLNTDPALNATCTGFCYEASTGTCCAAQSASVCSILCAVGSQCVNNDPPRCAP